MKTLYIIAAFLLFGITASYAINTSKTDSSRNAYILAKREIEKMLDGKVPLSYEKAIFFIENAWYNNRLDRNNFITTINKHKDIILRIMLSNWHPPKDTVDFIGQKVDRTEAYAKALGNWAIYKYMTDSIHFSSSSGDGGFHTPYRYSTADPFGSNDWTNTQVSNLDKTGQGNCFALSSMFKILADRLGSEAMLCTAPSHIYIRHADENGTLYNVEVGSRDFPGTGTISTLTYSTTESIRNDITLRDLDDKKAVALCLVYLAKGYEHKFGIKTDDFVLDCANKTLKYDDHNLNAMLLKAEVLETRLAMQRRLITQLQGDKTFMAYENLITKLYALGYREIPKNMKNLLVRTYTMDSVRAMQARVYDGKTSYASLSWGMFDEAHDIKPTELYNHTVFNTTTKKIDGFTKPDDGNSYNFDPIVFALNVDPMAAAPHNIGLSPYSAMGNNPILNIDPDGQDFGVYISGKEKTITIKTTYYTDNSKAAYERSLAASNYYNGLSDKFKFTDDKTGEIYSIKFDFKVSPFVETKNKTENDKIELQNITAAKKDDEANFVRVERGFADFDRYQAITEQGGDNIILQSYPMDEDKVLNWPSNKNISEIKTIADFYLHVAKHEDLHSLGLSHDLIGKTGATLDANGIKTILTYATEHQKDSKNKIKVNGVDKKWLLKISKKEAKSMNGYGTVEENMPKASIKATNGKDVKLQGDIK